MSTNITWLRAKMGYTQEQRRRSHRFALWVCAVAGATVAIWAWMALA